MSRGYEVHATLPNPPVEVTCQFDSQQPGVKYDQHATLTVSLERLDDPSEGSWLDPLKQTTVYVPPVETTPHALPVASYAIPPELQRPDVRIALTGRELRMSTYAYVATDYRGQPLRPLLSKRNHNVVFSWRHMGRVLVAQQDDGYRIGIDRAVVDIAGETAQVSSEVLLNDLTVESLESPPLLPDHLKDWQLALAAAVHLLQCRGCSSPHFQRPKPRRRT